MFQRIARRRADRSEEPGAADASGESPTTSAETPTADAPTIVTPPLSLGDGAAEAPTQRIDPVAAPAGETAAPVAEGQATSAAPPPEVQLAPHELTMASPPAASQPGETTEPQGGEPAPSRAGFRARGRMRRRLRYLRRLRELQVRDLGGLVFDLRRFERKRDDLVAQKIDRIRACDDELRALELALGERRELRDVREPGIGGTCPRCFAVHGSADRFCASCGAALGGAVQGPAQVPPAPPPAQAPPRAGDPQP